jgi:hypothetical protein
MNFTRRRNNPICAQNTNACSERPHQNNNLDARTIPPSVRIFFRSPQDTEPTIIDATASNESRPSQSAQALISATFILSPFHALQKVCERNKQAFRQGMPRRVNQINGLISSRDADMICGARKAGTPFQPYQTGSYFQRNGL